VIQNGDRIEVITSQNSRGPSRDWLKIVKSSQARNKINQWFKQELKEENIIKGKEMLTTYCKAKGIVQSDIMKSEYMDRVMAKYGFRDWDAVLAALGHGGLKEGQVVNKLLEGYEQEHRKEITDAQIMEAVQNSNTDPVRVKKSKGGITVQGIDDVSVRFAKCCSPIPGDEIVGFVTRGRGVTVHRTDCINIINLPEEERARLIDAEWQREAATGDKGLYLAEIIIYCNNRTGLLVDITKIFTESKIDVNSINSRTSKQGIATIALSFEVSDKNKLNYLVEKIRQVESVIDVERTTG
jgi:GTP pyrophosphokinase